MQRTQPAAINMLSIGSTDLSIRSLWPRLTCRLVYVRWNPDVKHSIMAAALTVEAIEEDILKVLAAEGAIEDTFAYASTKGVDHQVSESNYVCMAV